MVAGPEKSLFRRAGAKAPPGLVIQPQMAASTRVDVKDHWASPCNRHPGPGQIAGITLLRLLSPPDMHEPGRRQ